MARRGRGYKRARGRDRRRRVTVTPIATSVGYVASMSRPAANSSALRKFARGVQQVQRLRSEVEAFEGGNAYTFRMDVESRTTNSVTYRCVATEREPPSDEWPLLAGEAIQNLRSSLDHVIWASAEPPSSQNQFPICTDPDSFAKAAKKKLRRVPEPVRTVVEKWQPYRRSSDAPAHAMLEQLRVLSNRDKHRMLTAFVAAVGFEGVGVPDGVKVTWNRYGTNRELGDGDTHVSTFVATYEAGGGEVHLEPHLSYEVRIEGRSVSLLKGIAHEVYRVLVECETGQPLSPLAPYPLP